MVPVCSLSKLIIDAGAGKTHHPDIEQVNVSVALGLVWGRRRALKTLESRRKKALSTSD